MIKLSRSKRILKIEIIIALKIITITYSASFIINILALKFISVFSSYKMDIISNHLYDFIDQYFYASYGALIGLVLIVCMSLYYRPEKLYLYEVVEFHGEPNISIMGRLLSKLKHIVLALVYIGGLFFLNTLFFGYSITDIVNLNNAKDPAYANLIFAPLGLLFWIIFNFIYFRFVIFGGLIPFLALIKYYIWKDETWIKRIKTTSSKH